MYEQITGENPYKVPMRIYPAVHYTMGGLWVDYNLMSNIPGLFVLGEANFSDHGANRLGASALMQGLADGYFVLPYTVGNYLAGRSKPGKVDHGPPRSSRPPRRPCRPATSGCSRSRASGPSTAFHRELGKIVWENCGMARNEGLKEALAGDPGAPRGVLEERQRARRAARS